MSRGAHILAALLGLVFTQPVASAAVRTVALSGQRAPGTSDDGGVTTFEAFTSGTLINDAGQVAFTATLAGEAIDLANNHGVWSERAGSLSLVARAGDHAPGMPPDVPFWYIVPSSLVLNSAGRTAFTARAVGLEQGVWSEGSGSLQHVASQGASVAGLPSGVTLRLESAGLLKPLLNDAGHTAFANGLSGTGIDHDNDEVIWSGGSGSLAMAVRTGDPAPGMPAGAKFDSFLNSRFNLNDAGHVAFRAALFGENIPFNMPGIWVERPEGLELVAVRGAQAPGFPAGATFGAFTYGSPALNNADQTAFYAFTFPFAAGGVTSSNNQGIWTEGSGQLILAARSGDQAPGAPSGVVFKNFGLTNPNSNLFAPVLNDAGEIAFQAVLEGPGVDLTNNHSTWLHGADGLDLVVRTGDPAPGVTDGLTFAVLGAGTTPALNAAGQIAFGAILSDGSRGIWATDRSGAIQLIAGVGNTLEVAPSDHRMISSVNFLAGTGNSDGRPSSFNNPGQLAFWAAFTDGSSGIFVSNTVAVPEPVALLLVAPLALGWASVLRRRLP
jgi:hypothetical protein